MNEVIVEKARLLAVLKENRKNHADTLEKAISGYRKAWEDLLERTLQEVRNGGNIDHGLSLPLPMDHRRDYDRAIKMLEMSTEDKIVISEKDFQRYVMDEWEWKFAADLHNMSYAAGTIPNLS
jgi:hypothetical protein